MHQCFPISIESAIMTGDTTSGSPSHRASYRTIDSHQHFWKLDRGDYAWLHPEEHAPIYRDFFADDLRPELKAAGMGEAGIGETVLVQATDTLAETHYLLELAGATDFVSGVVGWVDMESAQVESTLETLAQDKFFRGIRPMLTDIPDPDWMLRESLTPALNALAYMGLTFDALVKPPHLRNLLKLLGRHPNLKAVIDHGAKPYIKAKDFDGWAGDMEKLARETQVFCKLSGLLTEAGDNWTPDDFTPYIDHLFKCFGVQHLMFGSDWPVANLGGGYASWWKIIQPYLRGLSQQDQARLMGGTAAAFYGI